MNQLGTMGKYVRTYRPNVLSTHRIINSLAAGPSLLAFPQAAIIVQRKKIPDVSFYQGDIIFKLMREKTDALIIRAGQNRWPDIKFKDNWRQAQEHGILRSSYWFYDDRESPGKQAELWAELLHRDLPEMEIWVDWENSYGGSFGGLRNVVAFMEAMERFLPTVEIGMYTGYWWFREHSNAVTNAAQYEYLKRKKLFEAFYTNNAANVLIPNPWKEIYLWQFGTPAVGPEYGVATKEIDMSFINMSEAEFQQKYNGVVVPPPTGEPTMARYEATNLGDQMALRPDHHTDNAAIQRFPAGTKWHGDNLFTATVERRNALGTLIQKPGDQWLQVVDVNGDTTRTGWVAIIHMGTRYCDLVDNNPAPEPQPTQEPVTITNSFNFPGYQVESATVNGNTVTTVLKPTS